VLLPNTDQEIFGNKEFNEVTGHVGATYKVDESATVYGRYAVDHTPGGFSDAALSGLSIPCFISQQPCNPDRKG